MPARVGSGRGESLTESSDFGKGAEGIRGRSQPIDHRHDDGAAITTAFRGIHSRVGAGRDASTSAGVARYRAAAASNSATTSGTPTVAGFATASHRPAATVAGISGFTTIRRARSGAPNTRLAAG